MNRRLVFVVGLAASSLLLLAAKKDAPGKPVLEPVPGTGFNRLHPRHVTGSSFLKNGWNEQEQNYLPIYVADDDPATAWVEGVDGSGEGESLVWIGPALRKAQALRIFVRNGYQKSSSLYRANGRPRKIELQPLIAAQGAPKDAGPALTAQLADVVGWQTIDLPVPENVSGFRLTLREAFGGTKYEDTCISDVRVYVKGGDRYVAAAENAAAESIRGFVAERARAARAKQGLPNMALEPGYPMQTSETIDFTSGSGESEFDHPVTSSNIRKLTPRFREEVRPWLVRAARILDQIPGPGAAAGPTVRIVPKGSFSNAKAAFSGVGNYGAIVGERGALLHRKNFAVFEDSGEVWKRLEQAATVIQGTSRKDPKGCMRVCRKALAGLEGALEGIGADSLCGSHCTPTEEDELYVDVPHHLQVLAGQWNRVDGSVSAFGALHRGVVTSEGDREPHQTIGEEYVLYDGDLAVALVSRNGERLGIEMLDWDRKSAIPRIVGITEVRVDRGTAGEHMSVARYAAPVAAASLQAPGEPGRR